MLFPTDNNTEIGWIWNPFNADYSEECKKAVEERNFQKSKARLTLNLMFGLVLGF